MSLPPYNQGTTAKELFINIKKVSTLKKFRPISSDVINIYNLPCRFIAKLTKKRGKNFLAVFVIYNEDSDDKSVVSRCFIEFHLHNKNDPDKNWTKRTNCLFKHGARIHGHEDFLAWEEVIRPENEYVFRNEILLEAEIEMDKPSTPSYFSKEMSTGYYDLSNSFLKPNRGEVLFRFKIDNVMKMVREFSPTFYVRNMPWKIMAILHESKAANEKNASKKLGVFLRCYGLKGYDNWACYANVSIDIWNRKLEKHSFRRIFSHLYHKEAADWGIYSIINSERLTNEKLGFVKKGSLVIEVEVDAEIPIIIHTKKPEPLTINNFVIPDMLAHLYTLEDH